MSGPDAMHGEMPGFFPGRPGGERDEPLLDMIFDRRPIPPGAPPEMHDLARMLAAVAGPAEPGDLAGEAAVLAAFSPAGLPGQHLARCPAASPALAARTASPCQTPPGHGAGRGSSRAGQHLAAYVGVLPGPIQQMAHVTVGAPAPPPPSTNAAGATVTALRRRDVRASAYRPPRSPCGGILNLVPASKPPAAFGLPEAEPGPARDQLRSQAEPHPESDQTGANPEPGQAWSDPEPALARIRRAQLAAAIAGPGRLPGHRQPDCGPVTR